MNLIKLTEWESGGEVYVDPSAIRSMRRLPAAVYDSYSESHPPQELGARTRVDTTSDMMLVVETPAEILTLVKYS